MKTLAFFVIFIFLFYTNSFANELQKVSLQLHWKYQFEFAGFIAAKEKGFYKDAGLDVTLKEFKPNIDIEKDIINHKSTYGIYNSNLLKSYLQNEPIKLIASFFKRSALVIITQPNIKNIHDLQNKTIMATSKDDFNLNFKYIFDEEGINTDNLKLIPHSYNIKQFVEKKCDAMTAFISDQPYQLDKLNIKYNIIDPSKYGMYNLQMELFTSDDEVIHHQKRVEAFKQASIKGWQYALTHTQELIKIIQTKYSPQLSTDFLTNEAKQIKLLMLPKIYQIGTIDNNFLAKQLELIKKAYHISSNRTLKDFIYNPTNNIQGLTSKEKYYLDHKKTIRICYDKTFYPVSYNINNKVAGVSKDISDLIFNTLHTKVKYIATNNWIEQSEFIKKGKCDTTMISMVKPNYYDFLTPTHSYIEDQLVLVTKIDEPYFGSLNDIDGKTIGIKYGFKTMKKFLQHKYPKIHFVEIKNGSCQDIIDGRVFGCVTISLQASALIAKYYSNQLKIMTKVIPQNLEGGFGVNNNEPILLSILNKAISHIPKSTINTLYAKYYNVKVEKQTNWTIVFIIVMVAFIFIALVIFLLIRERKFNIILEEKIKEAIDKNNLQNQQMIQQSRLAQMGEMLSMIAHQWRQPLSAISARIGSLSLQLMMHKDIDKDILKKELEKIDEYTHHLSNTIDDFRNFFKNNKQFETTTIENVVQSTLDIIQVSIENHNIQLITDYRCNKQFDLLSNELKQVILNILKNAQDVLVEKKIQNPQIIIKSICNDNQKYPILYIKDNGGGIANDIINKIFDPYFSTKTEKNGTGLGLYMSKTIIQEHCGGNLTVRNNAQGAVFKIDLNK